MSAFGGKADIAESAADVRSWPYPDIRLAGLLLCKTVG